MAEVRFPITWSGLLRPVATVIGARRGFLAIGDDEIVADMGPLARVRFAKALVTKARLIDWPLLYGYGIRIYGRRALGLVGTSRGVVELTLSKPTRIRGLVPMRVDRLAVSVADPGRLVSLLRPPAEVTPTVRAKARTRTRKVKTTTRRKAMTRHPAGRAKGLVAV